MAARARRQQLDCRAAFLDPVQERDARTSDRESSCAECPRRATSDHDDIGDHGTLDARSVSKSTPLARITNPSFDQFANMSAY